MTRREVLLKLLKACDDGKSLTLLHSQILKAGFIHDSFLASRLCVLYAEYSFLNHARKLFDETPQRSTFMWNAMLSGYSRERKWKETLILFKEMVRHGNSDEKKPDGFTLPIALKACTMLRAFEHGEMVHGFAWKNGKVGLDLFVGSALIELYSKWGKMGDALKIFEEFESPDVVLWTSMVTGYEQNGFPNEAVLIFSRMVGVENVRVDPVMLVSLVSACTQLTSFKLGSCVHGFGIRRGFDRNLSLANSLLNLYAKAGSKRIASNLFRKMTEKDVISWSSMIACYAQSGDAVEALGLFEEMVDKAIEPNAITVVSILQACGIGCDLEKGRKIHKLAVEKGFDVEVSVSTALINMYMNCSSPDEALNVFTIMPKKDVISWAALINGYAQNGMAYKSMGIFCDMLSNRIRPDAVAMVNILVSCSFLGILRQASCLHGYVIRGGFGNNPYIGACLIELYSKCGTLDNAIKVFQGTTVKDVVIWSSMIAAHGVHGQAGEALRIFDQMIKSSATRPNHVTFLSILSACSYAGLVEEGVKIFDMMGNVLKLDPGLEHYGILVDLLGRKGELEKAMEIINQMPITAGAHVWGALLGACRIHHNVEMGERAAKKLFDLDPNHAGYYILLSNIYGFNEKWDNMSKIRSLVREKGMKMMLGQSAIEICS
ncbi:putative pentatricopeptide repeat-containing protein At3g01580 [Carica papaya]|uniref:putative pentatricopeptide repeat-containing protein At3g01580 n=1 Tax=Carica papaya TaxID=3649 RepID=UPI000B8C6E14|nr:putative pentatricopeptide repeat-containing protein At3g01580 [Carica papaya]